MTVKIGSACIKTQKHFSCTFELKYGYVVGIKRVFTVVREQLRKPGRHQTDKPDTKYAPSEAGVRHEEERRSAERFGYKLQVSDEVELRPPQLRRAAIAVNLLGHRSIRRPAAHDREGNAERHGDAFTPQ